MTSWQSAMIKGNECFDSHNWLEAERYYNRAIELLDLLWQQQVDSVEAIQGWVCGYHNLAATFEQQGQLERAAHCLINAHYTVIKQANNSNLTGIAQSIALRMSSITYKSLMTFKKSHASYEACLSELSQQHTEHNNLSHYQHTTVLTH